MANPTLNMTFQFLIDHILTVRDRLKIRMSVSTWIRRNQAIDLITLKVKTETVKPVSKQVSRFRVLFTRQPVLTIDTRINFLLYLPKQYDRLDNLNLYSVFGSGFIIDLALRVISSSRCHLLSICLIIPILVAVNNARLLMLRSTTRGY